MLSIVIPTLWRADEIHRTIERFRRVPDRAAELIVIDNGQSDFTEPDPRVKVVRASRNLFVNPSWNLGVALARHEAVVLANDDLEINAVTLTRNLPGLLERTPDLRAAGISSDAIGQRVNKDDDELQLRSIISRGHGFGCLMLVRKSIWEPIPEQMKVFYGDDFIIWRANLEKRGLYLITGLRCCGTHSKTSNDFIEHMTTDGAAFQEVFHG